MQNLKTSWECIFIGIQYIIAIIVKRQLYLNQNKCSRDLESFRGKFTLIYRKLPYYRPVLVYNVFCQRSSSATAFLS